MASVTTPMYRCPEQLDLWSNYPIGIKSDVWALGCVIFYICFQRHPFEDSAKLRIVNANFTLPGDSRYQCFHDIIKGCLQVDPNKRFDISMILDRLGGISDTKGWPLKGPVKLKGKPVETPPNMTPNPSPMHTVQNTQVNQSNNGHHVPNRPPPPRPTPANLSSGTHFDRFTLNLHYICTYRLVSIRFSFSESQWATTTSNQFASTNGTKSSTCNTATT